jgi:LPXTG-site transpeptidase (sortase) family protein
MPKAVKTKKATNSPKAPFKFKRHILAPFLGIFAFVMVMALLNLQWVEAQVQYHFLSDIDQSTLAISTESPANITTPTLSIPKLHASAPIIFTNAIDEASIEEGLKDGVVHFGASVDIGKRGNSVIFGHSSGLPWSDGNYKFIFTLLDKLTTGDKIVIDSKGTRYIYEVSGSKVVTPDTVSVLRQSDSYTLTLITCSPVGSNAKRLVVTAKQISPVPEKAKITEPKIPNTPKVITSKSLPSNTSSFWKSIKELF